MPEQMGEAHSIQNDSGLKQWDKGQSEINTKYLIQSAAFACSLVSTEPERYLGAVLHLEANVLGTLEEEEIQKYREEVKAQGPVIKALVVEEGKDPDGPDGRGDYFHKLALWKYGRLIRIATRNRPHEDDVEV